LAESEEIDVVERIISNWEKTHGDTRSSILTMHLCIEYRINKIIEKRFKNPNALDKLGFANKIRVLDGLGVVGQKDIKDLKILNEARNFFAHDLDVDSQEFEQKFLEKIKELSFYHSFSMIKPIYPFNVYSFATMIILRLLLLAKDEPLTKNQESTAS